MQEIITETDLKEFLKTYSGNEVDFYRFSGNYGDSLIFHGTKTLLDSLEISTNFVEPESQIKNKILFIDGGGNFVEEYSDVYSFLSDKHDSYEKIVILPHTINGNKAKELIESLNVNVTIFCREKVTYTFLKNIKTKANVYLWHDCAFYNDLSQYAQLGSGVLNAFRVDIESKSKEIPEGNEDISYAGWAMKPIGEFVEKIMPYEEIRTDRLHVAIAATLLGKKVKIYPNSYYKNNAIYEYSLKKYQDTIFMYDSAEFVNQKNIDATFRSTLNGNNQRELNIKDLYSDLITYNHELWQWEDKARDARSSDSKIKEAKNKIDKLNQLRNDSIRKIDHNLSELLGNTENSTMDGHLTESPGMLIDRISIMYIREFEVRKLVDIISDDKDLRELYEHKVKIVKETANFNMNYLDTFIERIKNKSNFFKVFNAIKIYNDPRIKKYINILNG